jgi:YNFM family putative membrane transporter
MATHAEARQTLRHLFRLGIVALTAFLTLVDLFATQAILPSLKQAYGASSAEIGFAVNACTIGMAIAGVAMAMLSSRIDRRFGVLLSLALLAIPTALLAFTTDLAVFTALRIAQGLFMSSAFTLMLAWLGEHSSARDSAALFAAYITGNVASNLFGRMLAAGLVDVFGLAPNFLVFSALNLLGAVLVYFSLQATTPMTGPGGHERPMSAAWSSHLRNPRLRAGFAIGFLILFAFVGTFTFVNFALVARPFSLDQMSLGIVYLVFLPSLLTTPLAAAFARRFGTLRGLQVGLLIAATGLPLLVSNVLAGALAGMALIAVGTFMAQAIATAFIGQTAEGDRGSASGLYLASYFLGGLAGSAVLGQVYDRWGWTACVLGIGVALGLALLLAMRLAISSSRTMQPVAPR